MSKYIIDSINLGINPVKVLIIGEGTYKEKYVDDLEELCDDYIRKEYRELPTEAYKRGYDYGLLKGKHDAEQDMYDKGYQKGFEEGKGVIHTGCEGCQNEGTKIFELPCSTCRNSYPNHWTAKKQDDEIKVGDIVERYLNGKPDSTGIYLGEDGDYWSCLFWTGTVFGTFAYPKNQFKKTGRHVDITDMLKGALE